ncbi:unnamed protein product [Penicillium salamii]|uniref:Rhodopsin domain-containing protein n=1 Tax=Penicillium salamii TaxID=1612424 RepID=A0A9W4JDG4_9EURO|nr:unnamed protein product [Penicillium salamii]CAG8391443.1 unnamed protein product [Penicillium salamii]CAG8394598.1 unnamed protein product [Penicillium salamii]CAG8397949.1 unnamed protein product [Penicillium salamii]
MMTKRPSELKMALKIFWASEWIWATATVCFRLAILMLYIEIFSGNKKFAQCAIGVGGLVALYWVATVFTLSLVCRPIQYNWNRKISGSCGNIRKIQYASAGFNMGMDLLVVLLPLPVVWKLRMSSRKKIGVTTSFAIGILTAGINLARIVQTRMCPSDDPIWCVRDGSLLMMAEMTAGIWVACVPTFGPLVFRRKKVFTRQHHLPTIGSARIRPRRTMKHDPLLSTVDHSHQDTERTEVWPHEPAVGPDTGEANKQELSQNSESSLKIPSRVWETSNV